MATPRKRAETYRHEDEALLRPEVGTQAQFRKRKPPKTYRYDSSLSPALDWDGQNSARELGEWLLAMIEEASALPPPHRFDSPRRFGDVEVGGLRDSVDQLKALSRPFLNWAGKAERLSFDVPTLPLFVHERLSTKAILETLKGHERDRQIEMQLFADPQLSLAPAARGLRAQGRLGEPADPRRLARRHELAARVRGTRRAGADDLHRPALRREVRLELPAVRAQARRQGRRRRDLDARARDGQGLPRHLGARAALVPELPPRPVARCARASRRRPEVVFVQISDENVHHVRELLDEVFGDETSVGRSRSQRRRVADGAACSPSTG